MPPAFLVPMRGVPVLDDLFPPAGVRVDGVELPRLLVRVLEADFLVLEVDGVRRDPAGGTRLDLFPADGMRLDLFPADGTRLDLFPADGMRLDLFPDVVGILLYMSRREGLFELEPPARGLTA